MHHKKGVLKSGKVKGNYENRKGEGKKYEQCSMAKGFIKEKNAKYPSSSSRLNHITTY